MESHPIRRRRMPAGLLLPCLLLLLPAFAPRAGDEPAPAPHWAGNRPEPKTEYEFKAFYMIALARFVDWPEGRFPPDDGALVIGVLGLDPFGAALDSYEGSLVNGHHVTIRRSRDYRTLTGCHLLYISESENEDLPRILAAFKEKSVLTFGETPQFLQSGGIIRFVLNERRLRMEINLNVSKAANLKIRGRVLEMMTVVNP